MTSSECYRTSCRHQLIAGIASVLALAGCASPAEKLVGDYLDQKTCADRAKFILEADKYKDDVAKYYSTNKDCVTPHGKIDAAPCKKIAVGDYCDVRVEKIDSAYCVKRTAASEFKIDWPCSVGWNSKPLKVVKAEHPEKGLVFRANAELSDDFPSGIDRAHWLSVRLHDDSDTENFFMLRSRDTAGLGTITFDNANRLKSLLSDGRAHAVTVEVSYAKHKDENEDSPFITWFFFEGWRSMSDAELAHQQKLEVAEHQALLNPGEVAAQKLKPCCDALISTSKEVKEPLVAFLISGTAEKCGTAMTEIASGDRKLSDALDGWGDQIDYVYTKAGSKVPTACSSLSAK